MTQTKASNEVDFVVKFAKPHEFEGVTYEELDLSGLEDLTASDYSKAEQMFNTMGYVDVTKEFNTTFCLLLAHYATGKPFEFFQSMKISNATKVKTVVSGFLFQSA